MRAIAEWTTGERCLRPGVKATAEMRLPLPTTCWRVKAEDAARATRTREAELVLRMIQKHFGLLSRAQTISGMAAEERHILVTAWGSWMRIFVVAA